MFVAIVWKGELFSLRGVFDTRTSHSKARAGPAVEHESPCCDRDVAVSDDSAATEIIAFTAVLLSTVAKNSPADEEDGMEGSFLPPLTHYSTLPRSEVFLFFFSSFII